MKRQEPFKELISRCKSVSAEHKDFQVIVKEVYKTQNSTYPDIINDFSRRGSMLYDIRNPYLKQNHELPEVKLFVLARGWNEVKLHKYFEFLSEKYPSLYDFSRW